MKTVWDIRLFELTNGQFMVRARGPEGNFSGKGSTVDRAFAQCTAGMVYKPAFGPNWQYSPVTVEKQPHNQISTCWGEADRGDD